MLKSNLRQAWRWWSVRVSAFGAILMMLLLAAPDIWNALPAQLIAQLPDHVVKIISLLLFVTTMVARIVPQAGSDAPTVPSAAPSAVDAIAGAAMRPAIVSLDTASHVAGIKFDAQSGGMTFYGSHDLGSVGTADGAVKHGK